MAYGQQPGHGQPHGQPGYGAQHPPFAPPPQQYAAPQHYAPPSYGRPPRGGPQQQPLPPPPAPQQRRPETPTGGPVYEEDERWAVPAYVGMFVSGFVAPAIVLASKGKTSPFARFHAVQALNLFIAMFVCTIAAFLPAYLNGVTWLPLTLAVLAGDCFVVVKAAIGANRCEWYRLPRILAWPILH